MVSRAAFVAEVRSWIGTPFHLQASLKGVGCDCKGLLWGVARELGLPEAASVHAKVVDYQDPIPVARLKAGLAELFDRVPLGLADVLLVKTGQPRRAQHLLIRTGDIAVHAYARGERHSVRVVRETPLDVALRAFPLDSAWRFRSLTDD